MVNKTSSGCQILKVISHTNLKVSSKSREVTVYKCISVYFCFALKDFPNQNQGKPSEIARINTIICMNGLKQVLAVKFEKYFLTLILR